MIRNKNYRFQGFYEGLKKTIESDRGKYKEITKYCPDFFKLLCDILNDKLIDWNTKLMIGAALAYFVLPEDIIPDNKEGGYVDDLFIVCYVLREIKNNISQDLIKKNWEGKEDIISLIDNVYEKSNKIIGNYKLDILRKVGLYKYQSLDLGEYSGTYPEKIAKIANEKRELLGLLAFIIRRVYCTKIKSWKVEKIKEYLKEFEDYEEIERIIALSKQNHEYVSLKELEEKSRPSSVEEKLKRARMKVLMEEEFEE